MTTLPSQPALIATEWEESPWSPPAGVLLHNGDVIPPNMDFFEPPPEEIGEVKTVYSTLRLGKEAWKWWQKLLIIFGIALLIGSPIALLEYLEDRVRHPGLGTFLAAWMGMSLLVGLPLAFISLFWLRFKHTVTYVGELGVARITIKRRRGNVKRSEMFLFPDAVDLFTSQVRHYHNGVYAGTRYEYSWKDSAGKRVFRLKGSYYNSKGKPKVKSPYYFATAAEYAWSMLLLNVVAKELETEGGVLFRVNKKDTVLVGHGFLDFRFGSKEQRITPQEIGKINLGGGVFVIHHKDARRFSGQGKFSFAYGKMANARLFLLCLEKLCGYRFN